MKALDRGPQPGLTGTEADENAPLFAALFHGDEVSANDQIVDLRFRTRDRAVRRQSHVLDLLDQFGGNLRAQLATGSNLFSGLRRVMIGCLHGQRGVLRYVGSRG